jgi:putative phage-type endonuclease
MEQGSQEWHMARLGKLTGSRCHDAVAKTKSGYSMSRKRYMDELMEQRLTGVPSENFVSKDMQWGTETEPHARARYEFEYMVDVVEVGSIPHPTIDNASASPDGLVGEKGLIEIKCPRTTTMINTVLSNAIPENYVTQMNWQLACTQRDWCDFVMFDPRLPVENQIWIVRHVPEPGVIEELEGEVRMFLEQLDERMSEFLASMTK